MNNSRSWQKVGRGNANKLIPLPSAGRHTLFPPPTLCDKQIQRYSRHLLSLNPQIPSEYPYDRNPSLIKDQWSFALEEFSLEPLSKVNFQSFSFPISFVSRGNGVQLSESSDEEYRVSDSDCNASSVQWACKEEESGEKEEKGTAEMQEEEMRGEEREKELGNVQDSEVQEDEGVWRSTSWTSTW
ncbi:hypothetical protein CK203_073582 [Vitis vinifera]|uniref:Uncharacterized protein n=1 Tax=Vitis vinifera TaxID=29760 RepID=A0A438DTX8_VITVI|nr:hypothetical protein CK203_073582 [Vitis vinifera]